MTPQSVVLVGCSASNFADSAHGVVNIEKAASHMLHAQCVETGRMPHIEPPTRPCDRVAAMEANLCRLTFEAFEEIAKLCRYS
jgi:hypothetical protein